ncbi:MAG: hypothetical protein ACYC7L_07800 [Nitrospirota bacterium]
MHRMLPVIFLALAAFVQVLCLEKASLERKKLPQGEDYAVVIPSPVLKIAALEFPGFASDILFLRTMVFMGGTQQRTEQPRVKEWEWKWFVGTLENATELDPYFFDPYYYANAFLPWDAGMVVAANRLIEKGNRFRTWDWMMPFFIGFNEFYFVGNDGKAADYLMEASRRPGGNPMFASIASRLALKGNRTETAVLFMEELHGKTEDPELKELYARRIKALHGMLVIEKAVSIYKKTYRKVPSTIDDLVRRNILVRLPEDPYGGRFYLDEEGDVKSTTEQMLMPYRNERKAR